MGGGFLKDFGGYGSLRVQVRLEVPMISGPVDRITPMFGLDHFAGIFTVILSPSTDMTRRNNKLDSQPVERVRELRVIACMSPSRPDGVNPLLLRDLHDDINFCVVLQVLPPQRLHEPITQVDALGFGLELRILQPGYGDKLDGDHPDFRVKLILRVVFVDVVRHQTSFFVQYYYLILLGYGIKISGVIGEQFPLSLFRM